MDKKYIEEYFTHEAYDLGDLYDIIAAGVSRDKSFELHIDLERRTMKVLYDACDTIGGYPVEKQLGQTLSLPRHACIDRINVCYRSGVLSIEVPKLIQKDLNKIIRVG